MYKVLLVEDEAGIRNAVLQCFDWDSLDLTAQGAASGLDALNLCLRSTPDIVITDIVMPGIDGITLVRYLKHEFPDMRFIIITSYREFNYAKESLDMGVSAFLLKPIDEEELRSSLVRAIESIQAEQEHSGQASQGEMEEKYLAGLLRGYVLDAGGGFRPGPDSALSRLRAYAVAVMKFDNREDVSAINQHRLYNFCQTIRNARAIPCARVGEYLAFIYPVNDPQGNWKAQCRQYFTSVLQFVQETLHFSVSVGIGDLRGDLREASQGYLNAMHAIQYQFFAGKACVIDYDDISGAAPSAPNAYVDCEFVRSIDDVLRNSSIKALGQSAEDFFQHIAQNNGGDIEICRSEVFCVLMLCFSRLTSNNASAQAAILSKYAFFQGILSAQTLAEIQDLFLSILIDLKDYHAVKTVANKQAVVDKILEYLENHYSETITLSDVARMVYLSPAYVSTLISSETGKTFTDILNGIRVRKAIELIKNSNQKYYLIAEQVGFKEPQYFSIVFKKYTGMSPSDYKQLYFPDA